MMSVMELLLSKRQQQIVATKQIKKKLPKV